MDIVILGMLAVAVAAVVLGAVPVRASAHCDTYDGPTATDGRRALETGNPNHALKWVGEEHEAELRTTFERALRVRALGGEAMQLADAHFLETLVRLHRAGEGEPYTGLKPAGTPADPVVAAADRAIAERDLAPLRGLVEAARWPELERRFGIVLERAGYDVDDVSAGRRYIEAYAGFFGFAEGHEHEHTHAGHGHAR